MKRAAGLIGVTLMLASSPTFAQTQQPDGKGAASGSSAPAQSSSSMGSGSGDLKVQNAVPTETMLELRTAVKALREASVMLVEPGASKQAGPARDKAFRAAQDAIFKVQRAMIQLPTAYHPGEVREAKDWPVVAARIDKASVAIEQALKDLGKQGKPDQGAVKSLNAALDDAEKALRSMPEWRIQGKS